MQKIQSSLTSNKERCFFNNEKIICEKNANSFIINDVSNLQFRTDYVKFSCVRNALDNKDKYLIIMVLCV